MCSSRVDQGTLVVVGACVVIEQHHVHMGGTYGSGFSPKEGGRGERVVEEGGRKRKEIQRGGSEEVGGNHKQLLRASCLTLDLDVMRRKVKRPAAARSRT